MVVTESTIGSITKARQGYTGHLNLSSKMTKLTALVHIFVILGLMITFHLLIITGIIPYEHVWAGRLKSVEEMRVFESISILVIIGMALIFRWRYRLLKRAIENKLLSFLIWGLAALFFLNTIGNLFAESIWELIFGTAITGYLCFLCVVVARKE